MSQTPHPKEYAKVIALPASDRLSHFIGRVADQEHLWGIRNDDGWLVPVAPDGLEYFPVWPHSVYAQRTSDIHFPGHTAIEIPLDDFLDSLIAMLITGGVKIAVFPDENWDFWVIEPQDLQTLLEEELDQYE